MPDIVKAVILIFLLSVIVYSNSLGGEFLWDDELFVVKNSSIRVLKNFPAFFTDPGTVASGELWRDVYRPLVTIAYAIDYRLWKLNAFGYHLSSVLLHSFNGILVFLLFFLITKNTSVSFLTSLLFISHPIQTEAVSWISGRSSVQFLFFYLLSLILYITYLRNPRKWLFILSLLSFAVSVFSKEMAITLPVMLAVYDMHFSGKEAFKKRILRYAPYFIIALLYFAVRSVLLGRVSQMGWWGDSPYYTYLTMLKVVVDYIKILFFPVKLCAVFYLMPLATSIAEKEVVLTVVFLLSILALSFFAYRRDKIISFSIWWFFITLLPVMNIIPLKALESERFLYLPSIGFCLFVSALLWRITDRGGRPAKIIAIAIAFALIVPYSIRTIARNEDWKDAVTMSRRTIEASPMNPWALTSLGKYLVEKEYYGEALKPLQKAVYLSADFYLAHCALGTCYLKMGRYAEAAGSFKEALKTKPDDTDIRNSLGVSYANLKRYDEAEEEFKRNLRRDPTHFNTSLNLGQLYEMKGEYEKAIEAYSNIITNTVNGLNIAIAHMRIGDAYAKMGLKDRAKEHYEAAIAAGGEEVDALRALALDRIKKL